MAKKKLQTIDEFCGKPQGSFDQFIKEQKRKEEEDASPHLRQIRDAIRKAKSRNA